MSASRFAGLTLRVFMLGLPIAALISLPAQAAWKPYAIIRAPGVQQAPIAVSDGAGGAIVAWSDHRSGTWEFYVQRLRTTDRVDPAWPANGVLVPGGAEMVPDGANGAIVVGVIEAGGVISVRAYHVMGSTGVLDATWPAGGVVLRSGATDVEVIKAASDGAGGAVVAWSDDTAPATRDIYAQRVRSTGVVDPAWPVNGRAVYAGAGDQILDSVVSDGSGGIIAVWEDNRVNFSFDIYAQRVLATGTLDAGWPAGGRVLCAAGNDQGSAMACTDGAGGAIVFWYDQRNWQGGNTFYDIYGMRVKVNGQLASGWTSNGEMITDWFDSKFLWGVVDDGAGGAILTWWTSSNSDLYVQRIQPNGDHLWAGDPDYDPNGVLVSRAFGFQYWPALCSDGLGGAFISWTDGRFWTQQDPHSSFFLHHILASGIQDPTWTPEGTQGHYIPFTTVGNYFEEVMVQGNPGEAIAIWADRDDDLYAVNLNTTWTPLYWLRTHVLPAGFGTVTVDPDLPIYGEGQTVTLTAVPAPGKTFQSWGLQYASGSTNPMTMVMDRSKDVYAVFPEAIVGVDEPALSFRLERLSPSPSRGAVDMAYSLPQSAHVRLGVYDLSGRQLSVLVNEERPAGRHVVRWDGPERGVSAPTGIYFFRYETPAGVHTQRVAVIQ